MTRLPASISALHAGLPSPSTMRLTGHLLTSAAFASGLYAASGSLSLAGAALVGGTLIDLDHYLDYLAFHRPAHPGPLRFLHFYATHQYRRIVLVLHSWELLLPCALLVPLTASPLVHGAFLGVILHMALDVAFNGPRIRRPVAFYSFVWRLMVNFDKDRLLHPAGQPAAAAPPHPRA